MAIVDLGLGPALPIYAGPSLPRWQPRSVEDVKQAIKDGTLREHHWIDAKAEVGTTDGKRKEIACHLASFANDGGMLIIGVAEDKPAQKLWVEPVLLDGLPEQIDNIARSRCDPPLFILCHPLAGQADEEGRARGVVLVEIPPSPLAPHMVDSRYYGRNDTTKGKLTDSDVARLHAIRSTRQLTARQLIDAEIDRDPIPDSSRERSHLHVVVRPLSSPPDLLTHLIANGQVEAKVTGPGFGVPGAKQCRPNWDYLAKAEPRARGIGLTSHGVFGRRLDTALDNGREEAVLDVEVSDDGTVTLFSGGGSESRTAAGQQWSTINETGVVVLTRSAVTIAGQLGATAGYAGRWLLAVGLTDTAGKSAAIAVPGYGNWVPFSDVSYVQGTEATTAELLSRPGAVTTRLLHRMLRGLGTSCPTLLADADT